MSGLEVIFDRLTDDDRRYLFPPREQFFDHLNPLLIARHVSVETHYFLQFGKMTPQPSDIVTDLASIEPLQCKHFLAASCAACVISPLHKISNFLRNWYLKLVVPDSHSRPQASIRNANLQIMIYNLIQHNPFELISIFFRISIIYHASVNDVAISRYDLDARLTGKAGVELLRPAPNDLLRMWPVSKRVNASDRGDDDPSLIGPVEDETIATS